MANEASESTEINNGSRHFWLSGLIGFLTLIGIVVAARRYFVLMSPSIGADSVNPAKDLDENFARHRGLTLAHIVPAVFYIALLPFQFTNRLRARFPGLHRWNGRVLVGLGAYVAITALVMSFTMLSVDRMKPRRLRSMLCCSFSFSTRAFALLSPGDFQNTASGWSVLTV